MPGSPAPDTTVQLATRERRTDTGNNRLERYGEPSTGIANAYLLHREPSLPDQDMPRGEAGNFLGNNVITGKPFQLRPMGHSASNTWQIDETARPDVVARLLRAAMQHAQRTTPEPSVTSDEQERVLTAHGLRYRPDPMGRLGLGDWVGADGRVASEEERQRILNNSSAAAIATRQMLSRQALHPTVEGWKLATVLLIC